MGRRRAGETWNCRSEATAPKSRCAQQRACVAVCVDVCVGMFVSGPACFWCGSADTGRELAPPYARPTAHHLIAKPSARAPQIAANVSDFQKGLLTVKIIQAKVGGALAFDFQTACPAAMCFAHPVRRRRARVITLNPRKHAPPPAPRAWRRRRACWPTPTPTSRCCWSTATSSGAGPGSGGGAPQHFACTCTCDSAQWSGAWVPPALPRRVFLWFATPPNT